MKLQMSKEWLLKDEDLNEPDESFEAGLGLFREQMFPLELAYMDVHRKRTILHLKKFGEVNWGSYGHVSFADRYDEIVSRQTYGFFHTHPPGCSGISSRDVATMTQWLWTLPALEIFCFIECEGVVRCWVFEHIDDQKIIHREIDCFQVSKERHAFSVTYLT